LQIGCRLRGAYARRQRAATLLAIADDVIE
jgi:hypothetical protein